MHWCGDKHCRSTWPQRSWDVACEKDKQALEEFTDFQLRALSYPLSPATWVSRQYRLSPATVEWVQYRLALLALWRAALLP